jgi:hypothetical protein
MWYLPTFSTYSRVWNKQTGRLLENEEKSHLYELIRNCTLIDFQQKDPPTRLFIFVISHGPPNLLFFCSSSHLP